MKKEIKGMNYTGKQQLLEEKGEFWNCIKKCKKRKTGKEQLLEE